MSIFKKKNIEDSVAFRREMAQKIVKKRPRYVGERINGEDLVVSKGGEMHIKDGEFVLTSGFEYGSKTVFRCKVDKMKSSELMSLEGAILEGPDEEHGGTVRKIIVYYVYYIY